MPTIKFFPTGETVRYEIRPGVFIDALILGRTPTLGRYRCRYTPDDGTEKEGVVDSHNLHECEPVKMTPALVKAAIEICDDIEAKRR